MRARATSGRTTVWGKPPDLIHAEYTTADGTAHRSILLVSGFWGIARHFHYVPELTLALAWSLPAGVDQPLPYFYLIFLTILSVDRTRRDSLRCRTQYRRVWEETVPTGPLQISPLV